MTGSKGWDRNRCRVSHRCALAEEHSSEPLKLSVFTRSHKEHTCQILFEWGKKESTSKSGSEVFKKLPIFFFFFFFQSKAWVEKKPYLQGKRFKAKFHIYLAWDISNMCVISYFSISKRFSLICFSLYIMDFFPSFSLQITFCLYMYASFPVFHQSQMYSLYCWLSHSQNTIQRRNHLEIIFLQPGATVMGPPTGTNGGNYRKHTAFWIRQI